MMRAPTPPTKTMPRRRGWPKNVRMERLTPRLRAYRKVQPLSISSSQRNLVRMSAFNPEPTPDAGNQSVKFCRLAQKERQAQRRQHHPREDDAERGPG